MLIALYLAVVSGLSVLTFAMDKYCAVRGLPRVPERTLLLLAALGGTPGAFAAQQLLRHKTRKQPFKTYLTAIAAVQAIAVLFIVFFGLGPLLALL